MPWPRTHSFCVNLYTSTYNERGRERERQRKIERESEREREREVEKKRGRERRRKIERESDGERYKKRERERERKREREGERGEINEMADRSSILLPMFVGCACGNGNVNRNTKQTPVFLYISWGKAIPFFSVASSMGDAPNYK
jgi:hypothetical protein